MKIRMTTNLEAHLSPLNKADPFLLSSGEAGPLLALPDVSAGVHSAPHSLEGSYLLHPKDRPELSALSPYFHALCFLGFCMSPFYLCPLLLQEWHFLPLSEIQRDIFYLKISGASAIKVTIFMHTSVILFVLKSCLFFC